MSPPDLVVHADWSVAPRKRWMARARRTDVGYEAEAPEPVGPTETLLERLEPGSRGSVLLGVDFPIGVPLAWAERAGVHDFPALLLAAGEDPWQYLFEVAETPSRISLQQPFYPQRPGGTRREHLVRALGVADFDALLRRCEGARRDRRAASPLFWTIGAQQVGKAAIAGWRDVLAPALRSRGEAVSLWPFAGPLDALLVPGRIVIAETYPAEAATQIGVAISRAGASKRDPAYRRRCAPLLQAAASALGTALSPELDDEVAQGFPAGEDAFDATLGLLGMLRVVHGHQPPGDPPPGPLRSVEGWILGLPCVAA